MRKINTKRRFSVDEKGYLVDKANAANNGKYRYCSNYLKDDRDARYYLLYRRLWKPVSGLFVKSRSREYNGHSLHTAILHIIAASHLHTTHPMVAVQHQFRGKLHRKKKGMQDVTSIAFFLFFLVLLLWDLYFDI